MTIKKKTEALRLPVTVLTAFVLSFASLFTLDGTASAFSGSGSGTVGAPYQITTCVQLQEMNDDLGAHYILMNDIDCSATSGWNAGEGFAPIGDGSNFTGTLDGQNHVITDLFINRSDDEVGLFGFVLAPAEISNLGLTGVDITGDASVGGLVGSLQSGATVENSYTAGNVNTNDDEGGGLVGANEGIIRNSYSDVEMAGDGGGKGGLVGDNDGTIEKSYALGNVSGGFGLGGLVSTNYGDITDSYATGNVSGDDNIGGLVGYNDGCCGGGTITNSYSIGSVTGANEVGGLVGHDELDAGTATESFWDTETSGQATSALGVGKTTAELKNIATLQAAGWSIVITNDHNLNNGYPFLSWQAGASTPVWYVYAAPVGGSPDTDLDDIPDVVEDAAPNSGDANNDGTADSDQGHVASFVNQITTNYTVLEVNAACQIDTVNMTAEASNATADAGFNYPVGLMNFTVNCGTPGYTTGVSQYYFGVTNNGFALRKYKPNTSAYFTVSGATLSQVVIGGQTATNVTYQATDGGDLDTDGTVNGIIVDPVGLAQGVVGAPNTGLGGNQPK